MPCRHAAPREALEVDGDAGEVIRESRYSGSYSREARGREEAGEKPDDVAVPAEPDYPAPLPQGHGVREAP